MAVATKPRIHEVPDDLLAAIDWCYEQGWTDGLPVVPADAVTAWAAHRPWERSVVEGQMRATYAEWLEGDPLLDTAEGTPSMAGWTPVARPVAARRRSLL